MEMAMSLLWIERWVVSAGIPKLEKLRKN